MCWKMKQDLWFEQMEDQFLTANITVDVIKYNYRENLMLLVNCHILKMVAMLKFDALTKLVSFKRCRTIAYHPETNGIIKLWHRFLKIVLMCHGEAQQMDTLPIVLLGLRTCFTKDLCTSVAELVYGTSLKIPCVFFFSEEMSSEPRIFIEDVNRLKPASAYLVIHNSGTTPTTASPPSTKIPVQCESKTYSGPIIKRKTIRFKI
ncbi:hypothetical protein ALC62_15367 [Cyphomyrmex costatus]|uniref:Integrase catalytic domain-containing protein n=1 Tax=Cyphomyrmex costatus TaxID=456900 RepID=A0A151I7F5_9HYME|nr:hypothetical protein ALC62_15367 [Cyphomyrmex costatus]